MSVMVEDGFLAEISIDEERGLLCGIIVNFAERPIRFEAETVPALQQAMRKEIKQLGDNAEKAGRPKPTPAFSVGDELLKQVRAHELIGTRKRAPGFGNYLPLAVAYTALLQNLWMAREVHEKHPDFGRRGAAMACAMVANFLRDRWESTLLAVPFVTLIDGLNDVERKMLPDVFSTRKETLRRPRSTTFRKLKDFAAALLEVTYRLRAEEGHDSPLVTAARDIAGKVGSWNSLHPETVMSSETLIEWRSEVKSRRPAGRRDYDTWVDYLSDLSPDDRARELLVRLREGLPGWPTAVDADPENE